MNSILIRKVIDVVLKSKQTYYDFGLSTDTLSDSLGGGIPVGTIMLIVGKFGTGKSVVCQRLTYGLLRNGYTVTYVSTETNTKPFMNQMNSLDYPIGDYIFDQRLKFVPVKPLIGNHFQREESLSRLIDGNGLYSRDITIIDTFSDIVDDNYIDKLPLDALSFFKKKCNQGKTLILTMNPSGVEDDILVPYMSAVDIYLQLDQETIGGDIERTIKIRRFTAARGRMKDVIKYRIEPNAGFVVDITSIS